MSQSSQPSSQPSSQSSPPFEVPVVDKLSHRLPPGLNRGYPPPRSESQSLSLGVQPANRMNDFFEAFADPAGFREQVSAYFVEAERVATTLVSVFEDALSLEPGQLQAIAGHSIAAMRLINYALPGGTDVVLDGDADALVAPLAACVDEHVRAKIEGSNVGILNTSAGRERERVLRAAAREAAR